MHYFTNWHLLHTSTLHNWYATIGRFCMGMICEVPYAWATRPILRPGQIYVYRRGNLLQRGGHPSSICLCRRRQREPMICAASDHHSGWYPGRGRTTSDTTVNIAVSVIYITDHGRGICECRQCDPIKCAACSRHSRGRLNIKMLSYQYRVPHVKDKTVSPTVLSLTWESPYMGKTVFILRRCPGWYHGVRKSTSHTTVDFIVSVIIIIID